MNNSYDREAMESTELLQESLENMIGNPVKLLLLESGQTIITECVFVDGAYALYDPRVIQIAAAAPTEDGLGTQTTVNYSDWMPLAEGREFTLSERYVVLVTDPIPNLIESYARARTNGWTSKSTYTKGRNHSFI